MKSVLVTILLFISFLGHSQFIDYKNRFTNIDTIFQNLHNGAILVRLDTNTLAIKAIQDRNTERAKILTTLKKDSRKYRKTQNTIRKSEDLINSIRTERDTRNNEIIKAFDSLTYCHAYYFYANDSKSILNKQFEGILRDKKLQPLKKLPVLKNNYLLAEFGQTTEDTASIKMLKTSSSTFPFHPNKFLERDNKGNIVYEKHWYSSTGMEGGVDALVLLSPEFIQLQNPYPHYVRTYEGLRDLEALKYIINKDIHEYLKNNVFEDNKTDIVIKLQNKIEEFIQKQAKPIGIIEELANDFNEIIQTTDTSINNNIVLGFYGEGKNLLATYFAYEHLFQNKHGINLGSMYNFVNKEFFYYSINYRYYIKKNMNSSFVGSFLNYSDVNYSFRNSTEQYYKKNFTIGLNAGRKWVFFNTLSLTIGAGIGLPIEHWIDRQKSNGEITPVGGFDILYIEGSIGYCF